MESSELVHKFCQFFLVVGPGDESVIYISEPAYRLCASCSIAFFSKTSMKKFTIAVESGEPIATPTVFFRRTVHQNRSMWMLVRVITVPGHHLQSDDGGVQVNPQSELW